MQEKKPEQKNNEKQPMIPPGMHLDPQLPDKWSEADLAKLERGKEEAKPEK